MQGLRRSIEVAEGSSQSDLLLVSRIPSPLGTFLTGSLVSLELLEQIVATKNL